MTHRDLVIDRLGDILERRAEIEIEVLPPTYTRDRRSILRARTLP